MALAGMATAAEDVVWTLSNGDIIGGSQRYGRNSLQFTLTDAENSYSAVPSVDGAEFSTYHQLQSITVWTYDQYSNGVKGILMTADKTIIATTISNGTNSSDANKVLTFDFSNADAVLESGETYLIAFTTYSNTKEFTPGTTASSNHGDYISPSIYVAKNEGGVYDTTDLKYNKMEGSTENYLPGIKIVTKAIPEPTTATLSLLALAGLAARRRRK